MGKKIVVDVTEVGVPTEVRVGYLLMGIGGINVFGALLLFSLNIEPTPHSPNLSPGDIFISAILLFLFAIFGIIVSGLCA